MEIGTWNGAHAKQMIECASKYRSDIEYYGFDLFEAGVTWESEEQGGKVPPPSVEKVLARLNELDALSFLVKGDTRETLVGDKLPTMDFVFIDGGHSIDTIASDWANVQLVMDRDTVVIFDDYYHGVAERGSMVTVEAIDRNEFDVELLDGTDEFKKEAGVLRINFVKVTRRG